jgi:hypothetical protein
LVSFSGVLKLGLSSQVNLGFDQFEI